MLFRDKKLRLHLLDVDTQARTTLLNYCSYVQVEYLFEDYFQINGQDTYRLIKSWR